MNKLKNRSISEIRFDYCRFPADHGSDQAPHAYSYAPARASVAKQYDLVPLQLPLASSRWLQSNKVQENAENGSRRSQTSKLYVLRGTIP